MKKPVVIIAIVVLLLITLFGLSFLGYKGDITLNEDTMQKISQICWSDPENLEKIGFEIDESGEFCLNVDETVHSCRSVSLLRVSKSEEVPNGLKQYDNYSYKFTESTMGKFDIRRYMTRHVYSYRRYTVYIDGMEIHLREDGLDGDPYSFEEAINIIYKKQRAE